MRVWIRRHDGVCVSSRRRHTRLMMVNYEFREARPPRRQQQDTDGQRALPVAEHQTSPRQTMTRHRRSSSATASRIISERRQIVEPETIDETFGLTSPHPKLLPVERNGLLENATPLYDLEISNLHLPPPPHGNLTSCTFPGYSLEICHTTTSHDVYYIWRWVYP